MIDGDLQVIEREGTPVVVDATSEEVVCQRKTPYAHGIYHRIDTERYERDGAIRPACRVTGVNDDNWKPVARAPIEPMWDGCTYQHCYGPTHEHGTNQATGDQLRTTLLDMTVEEFDQAVAAQRGGEH